MAKRLLNLRNVPDDEADDVRELLAGHAVEFYETPPSRWGISMGAIWLVRDDDYPRARTLFDEYQVRRANQARADYEARKRRGEVETFIAVCRRRPVQVGIYLLGTACIIALMMWPVWLSLH